MARLFFEEVLRLDPEWRSSSYESVTRWIKRLRRKGSVATMRAYFKILAWFVRYVGVSPDDFVRLPREDVERGVQGFCDGLSSEGKQSHAANSMKAIRSFLKANGFRVEELELDASYAMMKRPEYVPTKEDVYRMASIAGMKWRAILLCLFQSGLRNSTLRALTYGMLKDQIESSVVPIKVHVTSELRKIVPDACKEGVDYWTFFGPEACEALRQYMAYRRDKYGKIGDEEPLFPSESRTFSKELRMKKPMDQWSLTRMIKKIAKRAGIPQWKLVRTHSLRKTFRAVLDAGYVDGGQMAEDDKEYLMGHKLPGNKAPYHNANVDVLAQRYMRLSLAPKSAMSREGLVDAIKAFAKSLGVSDIEIKIAKLREEEPQLDEIETIGRIIRSELGIKPIEMSLTKRKEKHNCSENANHSPYGSKIVRDEKELIQHLDEGWDLVKEISGGRFIVRRTNLDRNLT